MAEQSVVIVSHKHRFIFLKTRKTGGTSIELALRQICGDEDVISAIHADDEAKWTGRGPQHNLRPVRNWPLRNRVKRLFGSKKLPRFRERYFYEHMTAARVRAEFPGEWSTYYKFSVERNPWDRQVSLFYWRQRNVPEDRKVSFGQFLRQSPPPLLDNWEIYAIRGSVSVDRVLPFERLSQSFAELMQDRGIAGVPALGRAKSGHRPDAHDYREHYDAQSRALVASWYAREIAEFGYEF